MARYLPHQKGECPHCRTTVRFEEAYYSPSHWELGSFTKYEAHARMKDGERGILYMEFSSCPECDRLIVGHVIETGESALMWPRASARGVLHAAVPEAIAKDYYEAVDVLPISSNASAALARRCLQHMLKNVGADGKSLYSQIQSVYDGLPSYVQSFVDKIRELGNLAAHPTPEIDTATIVDVDPAESEWILALLEELFDHYYIKPHEQMKKHVEVETKLGQLSKKG